MKEYLLCATCYEYDLRSTTESTMRITRKILRRIFGIPDFSNARQKIEKADFRCWNSSQRAPLAFIEGRPWSRERESGVRHISNAMNAVRVLRATTAGVVVKSRRLM